MSQLRRINDVVRLGHVRSIEPAQIVLDNGSVAADPDTLYIDCSAAAIVMPPKLPVFDGQRINLFMVRTCQPVFSAAVIAYVESHVADPAEKNSICTVVPSPEVPIDWLRMWAVNLRMLPETLPPTEMVKTRDLRKGSSATNSTRSTRRLGHLHMSLGIDFLSHKNACLVRDKLNRHFLQ